MDSMLAISDEKSDRKPMILETIPELQRLSPRQRLILATELMEDFQEHPTAELDGAIAEPASGPLLSPIKRPRIFGSCGSGVTSTELSRS